MNILTAIKPSAFEPTLLHLLAALQLGAKEILLDAVHFILCIGIVFMDRCLMHVLYYNMQILYMRHQISICLQRYHITIQWNLLQLYCVNAFWSQIPYPSKVKNNIHAYISLKYSWAGYALVCFLGQILNSINPKICAASKKLQVINAMCGPRSHGHQLHNLEVKSLMEHGSFG